MPVGKPAVKCSLQARKTFSLPALQQNAVRQNPGAAQAGTARQPCAKHQFPGAPLCTPAQPAWQKPGEIKTPAQREDSSAVNSILNGIAAMNALSPSSKPGLSVKYRTTHFK